MASDQIHYYLSFHLDHPHELTSWALLHWQKENYDNFCESETYVLHDDDDYDDDYDDNDDYDDDYYDYDDYDD